MRVFKPKGLRIYVKRDRWGEIARCRGAFRTRGRRGAATRSAFAQLSDGQRQTVLRRWLARQDADVKPTLF